MLDIDEILKLSREMGVEIADGTSGKHYILSEDGEEIEFTLEMLFERDGRKDEV